MSFIDFDELSDLSIGDEVLPINCDFYNSPVLKKPTFADYINASEESSSLGEYQHTRLHHLSILTDQLDVHL